MLKAFQKRSIDFLSFKNILTQCNCSKTIAVRVCWIEVTVGIRFELRSALQQQKRGQTILPAEIGGLSGVTARLVRTSRLLFRRLRFWTRARTTISPDRAFASSRTFPFRKARWTGMMFLARCEDKASRSTRRNANAWLRGETKSFNAKMALHR